MMWWWVNLTNAVREQLRKPFWLGWAYFIWVIIAALVGLTIGIPLRIWVW